MAFTEIDTQTLFQSQGLPFIFLSYLPSNTVVRAGAKQIELNSMWLFKAIKLAWQLFVLGIHTNFYLTHTYWNIFLTSSKIRNGESKMIIFTDQSGNA